MPNLPRTEQQEIQRQAGVSKRQAEMQRHADGVARHKAALADPKRLEALKKTEDFHLKGQQALVNSKSGSTPQMVAAAKEYQDYVTKAKALWEKTKGTQTLREVQKRIMQIEQPDKYAQDLKMKKNFGYFGGRMFKKGGAVKGMAEGGAADEDLMRYRDKMEKQRQKLKADKIKGISVNSPVSRGFTMNAKPLKPGSLAYAVARQDMPGSVTKDKTGNYVSVPESNYSQTEKKAAESYRARVADNKRKQEANYIARRNEKAESQKLLNAMQGKAKGGAVKSASSRADGCAVRGKTRA